MEKKFAKIVKVDVNDILKKEKFKKINKINHIESLINSVDRNMINKILLILSIIASFFVGFFSSREFYSYVIGLGLVIVIFLMFSLIKEVISKKKLREILLNVYKNE